MNEKDANTRIRQWLTSMPTIKGIHFPDSKLVTANGWVDWVFLGPNGMLFREFKGTDDTLSPVQREVSRLIRNNGGDWGVWWPLDLRFGGRAEQELKTIA